MDKPKTWGRSRSSIRLKDYDYATPFAVYHVVLGSYKKQALFTQGAINGLILRLLGEASGIGDYKILCACLMPDHLHVLLEAGTVPKPLSRFVRDYKSLSSRGAGLSLWQRGFYEHVVRKSEDLPDLAFYILNNPVRAGLVLNGGRWDWTIPPP
jgi:REP element-mobilizing transposase RayT